MRRLLLLRHAKTVEDSGEGDFNRTLTERGRADAANMAKTMGEKHYAAERALCSSAMRTAETFEILTAGLTTPPSVEFLKALYLASAAKILSVARATSSDFRSLLIIGHNPGFEDLAIKLARKPQSQSQAKHLSAMREKYPTCALTVLDFDVDDWGKISEGAGKLVNFIRPRDFSG